MSLANGEQKIFIWIDFTPESEVVILHGIQVAHILDKEVCLISQEKKGSENIETKTSRLLALTQPIAKILGSNRVHHFTTFFPLSDILTELAEEYDALLLVAHKKDSKELLRSLPHSGFPFLFVSSTLNPGETYQKIAVPVGYMKKSKDLALWSSYFARHNGAMVTLIKAIESADADKKKVMNNLFSIGRLFKTV